ISNANTVRPTNQGTGPKPQRIAAQENSWGGVMGISRTVLWTAAALVLAGAAGFALLAYEREMAPVARPNPASFDKALVERGRVLANYGDCTAGHTHPNSQPFAGSLPRNTRSGTNCTANI